MPVKSFIEIIETKEETDIVNITDIVSEKIEKSRIENGIVTVFVPGSTASVSTIEYEPNLVEDVKNALERIAPSDIDYKHHKTWGDKNGKSHVRATIMGPSLTVPFKDRKLLLGSWQQIALLDFDVPARQRKIIIQVVGD